MNKKFSTLLMGGLLLAGAASAQQTAKPDPVNTTTSVVGVNGYELSNKTYYQIVQGASANGLALQATVHGDKDSIKTVAVNALPVDEKYETLDSTLWAISTSGISVAGEVAYSFVNKATGATLQFAKEGNAILAEGLNEWIIGERDAYGNATITNSEVVNGTKVTYGIAVDARNKVTIVKGNSGASFKLVKPGHIEMTAEELNNEGDGESFKLNIEDLTDTENSFVNKPLKAYNLSAGGVMLRVVGGELSRVDADNYAKAEDKVNKDVFVVVDTTMYAAQGGISVNGKDAFGYKFAADSLRGVDNNGRPTASTKYAPGRQKLNYAFNIYKDVTSVDGDQLIIRAQGVPTYDEAATESKFAGATQISYVSWAGFAEKGDELTTARIDGSNFFYELPVITLAAGAKADITPGVYYVKYLTGGDKDKYAYENLSVNNVTLALNYSSAKAKNMNNDLLSRTQYVVSGTNGKYTIKNRESANVLTNLSGRIYVKGDHFVKGGTEFTLEAVSEEIAADKHVGYKFFTDEEVGNLAVALKFNSKIGSAYLVAPAKESNGEKFTVAGGEEVEEAWFKVVPAGKVDFGVGMERVAYTLKGQFNNLYLDIQEESVTTPVLADLKWTNNANQAEKFVFRSTGKEGEYQIIAVSTTPDKFWKQLSVQASEANFNVLDINDTKTDNGFWTLETPAAPDYLTIEDAPTHKRIFSSENTSLAISMDAKRNGILKAVADNGGYVEDQFKMWVGIASVENAEKPLYYISTAAGLDEETREEGHMMYMTPGASKDGLTLIEFKEGYVFDAGLALATYRNGAVEKFVECKDMAKNEAAFAFQITPAEGEYVVENVANQSYLRQVNGVLFLTKTKNDALRFGIESVETPTANEGIAASEVVVLAGEGQVTIAGAAGKKVVISNILGQVVANTVVASDNATIAAPAGVVVVAVEGEAAVKAIVK